MYIISGCNGSGKTTASYTALPEMLSCAQFVNSDEFAKSFSPFNPEAASIAAGRFMLLKIRYLLERGENFCIETTLATRSLMRIIEDAKSKGYEVTLLYFWLSSPEMAVSRVKDRVASGGHGIPENVIFRRYGMGLHYFFNDYMAVCDRWMLFDNSELKMKKIASGEGLNFEINDLQTWSRIRSIEDTFRQNK